MVEPLYVSSLIRDLVLAGLGVALIVVGRLVLNRVGPRLFADSELDTLAELARMAVQAAEVVGHSQGWDGSLKLRFALRVLNESLGRLGIQLTEAEARAAVESAVLDLKVYKHELPRRTSS